MAKSDQLALESRLRDRFRSLGYRTVEPSQLRNDAGFDFLLSRGAEEEMVVIECKLGNPERTLSLGDVMQVRAQWLELADQRALPLLCTNLLISEAVKRASQTYGVAIMPVDITDEEFPGAFEQIVQLSRSSSNRDRLRRG